eukprot:CFRG4663T1
MYIRSLSTLLEVEKRRTRVVLTPDEVKFTSSIDFPGSVPGVDDSYSFDRFKENFRVDIVKKDGDELEFDLVGVDASVANAIRRIMLVNVKTMAIENVYIEGNTSIMQDEILAHRLGLVPINVNPYLQYVIQESGETFSWKPLMEGEDRMDCNTVVFTLRVKNEQTRTEKKGRGEKSAAVEAASSASKTMDVMSGDLVWEPQGWQETGFVENPIKPLHDDIVIVKIRPGQEIDVTMHCRLGEGYEHAKWSPVGTTSYRLLPEIVLKEEISGEMAFRLQKCFSKGVIEIDDPEGRAVARVANPRLETMTREVFRHADLAEKVELNRIRDHFIFSVESIGAIPPETIFVESIKILENKCESLLTELDTLMDSMP